MLILLYITDYDNCSRPSNFRAKGKGPVVLEGDVGSNFK